MKKQMIDCYFTCNTEMAVRILKGEYSMDGYLEVCFSSFSAGSIKSQMHPSDEWMFRLVIPQDLLYNPDENTLKSNLDVREGIPKRWISTVSNLDEVMEIWNETKLQYKDKER